MKTLLSLLCAAEFLLACFGLAFVCYLLLDDNVRVRIAKFLRNL